MVTLRPPVTLAEMTTGLWPSVRVTWADSASSVLPASSASESGSTVRVPAAPVPATTPVNVTVCDALAAPTEGPDGMPVPSSSSLRPV